MRRSRNTTVPDKHHSAFTEGEIARIDEDSGKKRSKHRATRIQKFVATQKKKMKARLRKNHHKTRR